MRLLDRMDRNSELVKFPYMRIDGRRYDPVTSWAPEDLWGLDFKFEKDGSTWKECWDAVMPVIRILDHFGVYYWLKYKHPERNLHVAYNQFEYECLAEKSDLSSIPGPMPSLRRKSRSVRWTLHLQIVLAGGGVYKATLLRDVRPTSEPVCCSA